MINFYYFMAALAYGIFVVQFILSQFFGDLDLDVDVDGDADFDVSDLVSFKGLVHFIMGCFGYLSVKQHLNNAITSKDWIIGVLLGFTFVIILYFIYKLCKQFETIPKVKSGKELVGVSGIIDFVSDTKAWVVIHNNGERQTLECLLDISKEYSGGQSVTILDYKDGFYYI